METRLTLMYRTCTVHVTQEDRIVNNTLMLGDVPSLIVEENNGLNLFVKEKLVK